MYRGDEESNTFRPREKHALQMKHIVDQTVPVSPQAGVPVPVDSGYASRDDASTADTAAPDIVDLACALEAVAVEDPGERQRKLFAFVNHKDYFLKSQRKMGFWKSAAPEFEKTLCKSNRARYKREDGGRRLKACRLAIGS